ncbi:MAG: hypothetical protein ABJO27_23265, partial [Pseudoruegeria sp.]
MFLREVTPVPDGALPLAEMKQHLRLGTGFSDDDLQDAVVLGALRSAIASIEARTGKALYQRDFVWVIETWRHSDVQALPIAPVLNVSSVEIKALDGLLFTDAIEKVRLVQDDHRPRLVAVEICMPVVPELGSVEVAMTAGYSVDWAGLKPDLKQAVLALAAFNYEHRLAENSGTSAWPAMVAAL